MKNLIPFLLLPSIVLAQPPEGQAPPPSFDQFKQTRLPLMEKSLPAMKETRECILKAGTKEGVEKCMNAMAEKAREIQKQAGGEAQAQAKKIPDDFKWDPQTKKTMLKNMDISIMLNTVMLECLTKSNSREEMEGCMREKLPAPKEAPAPAEQAAPTQ